MIQPRRRSLYCLMLLNLVMLITGIALTLYVVHLRAEIQETRTFSRAACERGNAIRENVNKIVAKVDGELRPIPIVDCEKLIP